MENGNFGVYGQKINVRCQVRYPTFMKIKCLWTTPHDIIAFSVWCLKWIELPKKMQTQISYHQQNRKIVRGLVKFLRSIFRIPLASIQWLLMHLCMFITNIINYCLFKDASNRSGSAQLNVDRIIGRFALLILWTRLHWIYLLLYLQSRTRISSTSLNCPANMIWMCSGARPK